MTGDKTVTTPATCEKPCCQNEGVAFDDDGRWLCEDHLAGEHEDAARENDSSWFEDADMGAR